MAPKSPRIYRVFVASPGDVQLERDTAFNVVELLNDIWEYSEYPAKLERLSWEKSTHSSAGKPQEVITKQIPFDSIDIFVAILWKKMGTPTKTYRPEDNRQYWSGTQQEIEEAYKSWKRTGRPIIMIYRKDEPIPATLSDIERRQFNRLNAFLHKFQPGGEYPALVKLFRANEFETLLRRELALATAELLAIKDQEKKTRLDAASEDDPNVKRWLETAGLKDNPFRRQNADEDDPTLPFYFARFPDLKTVTANDLLRERKTWVFWGKEGCGKTTLRKFLASRIPAFGPGIDAICLEYDQVKFDALTAESVNVSDFQMRFYRSLCEMITKILNKNLNISFSWKNQSQIQGNLTKLAVALRENNIQWVLCLIDPTKETFVCKDSQIATSSLIAPLLSFPEVGGYGFRYFLPTPVMTELRKLVSVSQPNKYRLMAIKWDENAILELIRKRMTSLSMDQIAPYKSLGELCSDENSFSSFVDAEVANLARGNPRGAIWLANCLIESHCDKYKELPRIALETWNAVKMAWWANGESRILGISGYDSLRILSNRIIYKSSEIVLPERSDRLLKCLIEARVGFRSKKELIKAGWKAEKNLDGISEKALSEAMRRMKDELNAEMRSKGFDHLDWIKSVRGRGYRLQQPNTSPESQEGKDE